MLLWFQCCFSLRILGWSLPGWRRSLEITQTLGRRWLQVREWPLPLHLFAPRGTHITQSSLILSWGLSWAGVCQRYTSRLELWLASRIADYQVFCGRLTWEETHPHIHPRPTLKWSSQYWVQHWGPHGNSGVSLKRGVLAQCAHPGKVHRTTYHLCLTSSSLLVGFPVGLYLRF